MWETMRALEVQSIHVSVDDPFQVFFPCFGTARAAVYSTKQTRGPLDVVVCSSGRLLALHILNFCLLVGRNFVIALLDGLGRFPPQSLRLFCLLLFNRSDGGRCWLGSMCVEKHFFLAGLHIQLVGGPCTEMSHSNIRTYQDVLDSHFLTPESRQLVQDLTGVLVLDSAANSVVCTADPALGLEFNVGREAKLRTAYKTVVPQLVLHFAKQNAAGVHIGLCQSAAKYQ